MARKISEIYQSIVDYKDADQQIDDLAPAGDSISDLLSDLTSNSNTAIWRLWAFVVAVAIWVHEKLWDAFKSEILSLANKSIAGTPRWYVKVTKEFQFGDALDVIDGKAQYPVIDESKQIVTHAAVEEIGRDVIIKAAKTDSGNLAPLGSTELDALVDYINNIKFAGTRTFVRSVPADKLKLEYTVYYNPLIGKSDTQTGVEAAINNYIESLPFNGLLSLTRLTDAIQEVEGVEDVRLSNAEERKHNETTFNTISRIHRAYAGYYAIDSNFPLSTTITYTASNVQY